MAKVAKMSQSLNTQKKAAEKQKCKKMKEKLKKRRRLSEALTVCWGLQATTKRLEGRKTITEARQAIAQKQTLRCTRAFALMGPPCNYQAA